MPHQFTPHTFVLERLSTDVRGSDFALVTCGPAAEALDNPVLRPPEVFAQRHMVHCSTLGLACDNSELGARLTAPGDGAGAAELRVVAQKWPPVQDDELIADLDSDVLQAMLPAARQGPLRPPLAWLTAVADDADAAGLGANLRGFLAQQLAEAAGQGPATSAGLAAFASGEAPAGVLRALAHPSWPHDGELAFELAATHAAAAAGASPPFAGDAPGGPLQLEVGLGEVVERYAAARACSPAQVQLAVLGTRQFRELRQHMLVMCTEGDAGLGSIFAKPLQAVQQYNQAAVESGGEVVAQPDSDGRGLTWWLQSSIPAVALEQELTQPWKTWLNIDPSAPKGASTQQVVTVAAHSLGNSKYDELVVGLYLPEPTGGELRLPLRRVRLRRGAALKPTERGYGPRGEEARAPSAQAVATLATAGMPLLAAPELVQWLKAAKDEEWGEVLRAIQAAGGVSSRGSPLKSPVRGGLGSSG